MNLIILFKKYFAMYTSGAGLNEGEVRVARGITDFLIDADGNNWTPQEFAGYFLSTCSRGDESHTDNVFCLIVVDFLRDALDKPPSNNDAERQQQIKDCLGVVKDSRNYDQIYKWAESWF